MKKTHLFFLFLLLPAITFSQAETLDVLNGWYKYDNVDHALYHHYLSQALKAIDKREAKIAELKTAKDWQNRQKEVHQIMAEGIGPFPEKTPLNARVLGISEKEDYSVERIVFESRPDYLVPAVLFVPKNRKGKVPGILLPMGHNQKAIRAKHYQRSAINLVKKGFVVLSWDPIGQGERSQFFSKELNKSVIGGGCSEHMYASLPIILTGRSLANYFVWDGIRALDYLISREEVDSTRIGITGLSGGATATTFGAAFDSRIKVAAPSCYISGMRRIFEGTGPQGPEQNLTGTLANGVEYPDFIEVRAPKPFLVLTTTRDFFSIQGARETEAEVEKVYKTFGAEDNFAWSEDDSTHAITIKNRNARHAFFQKHLNFPGDPIDYEINYLDKELQITKTNQVTTSFESKTILDVNKTDAEKLIARLNRERADLPNHLKNVIPAAKKLSGYFPPEEVKNIVYTGRYQKPGYTIERRTIDGEDGDYPIPFLLFLPNKITGAPVLYLNEDGKKAEAENGGDIEWFVKQGHPVVAADLITIGEMKQNSKGISFGEKAKYGSFAYSNFFAGVQLNHSVVGIQAGDIERLVKYIKQTNWFSGKDIYAVAKGQLPAASLLHAGAFEKEFSKIALINPLISYRTVTMNKYYYSQEYPPFVPGALTAYDLPDLMAAFTPDKLMLVNIRDYKGDLASDEMIKKDLNFVKDAYSVNKKELKIKSVTEKQDTNEIFSDWLK